MNHSLVRYLSEAGRGKTEPLGTQAKDDDGMGIELRQRLPLRDAAGRPLDVVTRKLGVEHRQRCGRVDRTIAAMHVRCELRTGAVAADADLAPAHGLRRSEEHTSELQSPYAISYA